MTNKKVKALLWPKAIQQFLGYLEGRDRSEHTKKSYELDLKDFFKYLQDQELHLKPIQKFNPNWVDGYGDWLKKNKQKLNTRRRKISTLRKFVEFHEARNQFISTKEKLSDSILPLTRIERVPGTFLYEEFLSKIDKFHFEGDLVNLRDKALLYLLSETAMNVREVVKLKVCDLSDGGIRITGTRERTLPISAKVRQILCELIQQTQLKLQERFTEQSALFMGFNRYGPMSTQISARGVEQVFEKFSHLFSIPYFTSRGLRHSFILFQLQCGKTESSLKTLCGFQSDYPFLKFRAMLKPGANPNP